MAIGDRRDPYGVYNFLVEIDGITRAGFQECSGLDSSQDAIDYREGTDPLTMRKLPGLVSYSNISLRWGISDDAELWEWRNKAVEGRVERRNISIVLMNDAREEKLRWNLRQCWPSMWKAPDFNAQSNDIGIESLEIVHEGVERA
jgi:phage tail-like protein